MRVNPTEAVLIGTYATERMGQIVAAALETEGIAAAVVLNGAEKDFPSLGLVRGVGVFVPASSAPAARQITEAIEGIPDGAA